MSRNGYFNYLCKLIGRYDRYSRLLHRLHEVEFYSLIDKDSNRAMDGLDLREKYKRSLGSSFFLPGPCTVLEMLIGLSYRMADELEDGEMERKVNECFWILIGNLGLSRYNDTNFVKGLRTGLIDKKIKNLLERTYRKDGLGGLFPLSEAKEDQRMVEIWYQMGQYLIERASF